jgi:hypoxanthine-guanine phosphoribosyltransferase
VKRKFNIKPDYVGTTVPNVWITGFGLDFNHKYRNLNDLVELDDEDRANG